jgi:hypothetical protein
MFRRIALTAVGALVFSAAITPATVQAKAVTGSVSCTLTGSAVISPGLPLNSPGNAITKLKTTTTFTGTLTNCTGAQMNTKKGAPIDGGSVKAVAKTTTAVGQALPSCSALTGPSANPTVLNATVKFTNGGKTLTSSKALLTVGAAVVNLMDLSVTFPASGPVKGGAFKGQTATATAVLDGLAGDLATLCAGGTSTTFSFTGVHGDSTLDIP